MKAKIAAVGLVLAGSVAYACFGEILASVHFNSTAVDLSLPPSPLLIASWDERATRDATEPRYEYVEAKEEELVARRKRVEDAVAKTQAAAIAKPTPENLRAAAQAARAQVEFGESVDSARDRAELFESALRTPTSSLGSYLRARAFVDDGKYAEARKIFADLLASSKVDTRLDGIASHWLYLDGLAAYGESKNEEAANLFEGAAGLKTTRRAPALIMVARTLLRGGDLDDNGMEKDRTIPPADLARAKSALDGLDAEFPNGRFAWSSAGWRGRLDYVQGNRGRALAAYLRQYESAPNTDRRINALSSISQTYDKLDAANATQFRGEVRKDPSLLRPYLEFRIHHRTLTASQRTSLYAFAQEFGLNKANVGGDLRASLAEMALLSGDTVGAVREANAALAANTKKPELAHYVLGGVAFRSGDLKTAETHFREAIKGTGPVARGAKEPLALIFERTNRPDLAADIYRELNYRLDYAYLLDVKMTLPQLKAYAERQPATRMDLVRYAYAMRLLRKERFDEAETILADLGNVRLKLAQPGSTSFAWTFDDKPGTTDILFDPLMTARDLRALKKTIAGARGEEKPQAMYALASYYYTRRNLLLYNASLWEGGRNSALSMFWSDKTNDAADRKVRLEHAYEHESLARARAVCLQIVKEFPDSPWAAKALYRAATAERRLADFNPQWRDISHYRGNLWKQAAGHLTELATRFPNDPLAANALKYAKVFEEEAGEEWKSASAPTKGRVDLIE